MNHHIVIGHAHSDSPRASGDHKGGLALLQRHLGVGHHRVILGARCAIAIAGNAVPVLGIIAQSGREREVAVTLVLAGCGHRGGVQAGFILGHGHTHVGSPSVAIDLAQDVQVACGLRARALLMNHHIAIGQADRDCPRTSGNHEGILTCLQLHLGVGHHREVAACGTVAIVGNACPVVGIIAQARREREVAVTLVLAGCGHRSGVQVTGLAIVHLHTRGGRPAIAVHLTQHIQVTSCGRTCRLVDCELVVAAVEGEHIGTATRELKRVATLIGISGIGVTSAHDIVIGLGTKTILVEGGPVIG